MFSNNRKSYSSNDFLLKLIKRWKKSLDDKNIIGPVPSDMFKTFDCILCNFFVAKLHACIAYMDIKHLCILIFEKRKYGVKITGTESLLRILLSGLLQAFILGPINLFINKLLFFINEVKLTNFGNANNANAKCK